MVELLKQRRWLGFTVFVLGMMVLCVFLARWQWSRYEERSAANDLLDAALAAPAVPVDDLLDAAPADPNPPALAPGLASRAVTTVGRFDAGSQVAVRRRPLDGRSGFWIVTPLVTPSGVLLVNRGWAPAGRDAAAAPEVPDPPAGQVAVTGRLRAAEHSDKTEPAPPGQAWAADPQELVTDASALRYPAYVELRSSDPAADDGLTALPDPGHRGLNNLVYSVQWLVFAAVAAVGWWRLMTLEARRRADELDATEPEAAELDQTDVDGASADRP
ncbi:MAG: SURF1 family cytochrome oxidase biogenesis protein [Candidatus Nanopelagicales bacterium]